MSENDINNIQNALASIEEALADKWWQSILYVLAGTVPALFLALISNNWSRKLFLLNKEKDEALIKAELIGDIKAVQLKIRDAAVHLIQEVILFQYNYAIHLSDPNPDSKANWLKSANESSIELNTRKKALQDLNSSLLKAFAKYNYFVKDKQIDILLEKYIACKLDDADLFAGLSYEKLAKLDITIMANEYDKNVLAKYINALDAAIDHVMYQKS